MDFTNKKIIDVYFLTRNNYNSVNIVFLYVISYKL